MSKQSVSMLSGTARAGLIFCVLTATACTSQPAGHHSEPPPQGEPVQVQERAPLEESRPAKPERGNEAPATEPPALARSIAECGAVEPNACLDLHYADGFKGQRPPEPLDASRFGTQRDAAALQKMSESLESLYLYWDGEYQERFAVLLATSEACEQRCSPGVQAKLWMYVGLFAGSGLQDLTRAACAFRIALQWDPHVRLDRDLATKLTEAAFVNERCAAGVP